MATTTPQLFIVLLGGRPPESTIEQHNVYVGVGPTLESLYPAMKSFWSTAPKIHIDAYMVVDHVGKYRVVLKRAQDGASDTAHKLFLLGLGGYRAGELAEIHKRILVVAHDVDEATVIAKKDPFFNEGINDGPNKAMPHIDSKQLLDTVDDDAPLDIGEAAQRQGYQIVLEETAEVRDPEVVITGYLLI